MSQSPHSSPAAEESKPYAAAWVVALLLIVVFVLGLLMYPPRFTEVEGAPPAPAGELFVGRFHPIVVHLPLGALAVLMIFELACLSRRNEARLGGAALLTLTLAAAGAVMAVLVGILLAREGGYEGGNFVLHQFLGISATVGVLLSLVLRIMAMGAGHRGLLDSYRVLLALTLAFLGIGAHFGGNLVHGNKYLTQYAPPALAHQMVMFEKWMLSFAEKPKEPEPAAPAADPVVAKNDPAAPGPASVPPTVPPAKQTEPVAGSPGPANGAASGSGDVFTIAADDSQLVFQHVLLPVLEAKCNKCHNEEKSKGDLRMDTHELLLKGGEAEPGKTVVPGKPDESTAIGRILLPLDDDEHMPPEGKDQMTEEETALLRWWIQEGASATQKVKDAKFPAATKEVVEKALAK